MKQIILNNETKEELLEKFKNYLNNTKFSNNTVNFTANLQNTQKNIEKPIVYISTTAFLKMMLYVQKTNTEIAWHGTVERNKKRNYYHITDVFLYPQTLTGVTVTTDQEKYNEWQENLTDDQINTLRFQGHSHVNMPVTPSSTDLQYYDNMLQTLANDDFYIFMIMNKQNNITMLIYDLETNTVYETEDIYIKVLGNDTYNLLQDIENEKKEYCTLPTTHKTDTHYVDTFWDREYGGLNIINTTTSKKRKTK